mmetsp:Transcript_6377/g.18196  ORF Transcript_6377/g.18196 Transcript_6377/m.18196 type:complete len:309 (-) Transcript_6377:562-1488(-)
MALASIAQSRVAGHKVCSQLDVSPQKNATVDGGLAVLLKGSPGDQLVRVFGTRHQSIFQRDDVLSIQFLEEGSVRFVSGLDFFPRCCLFRAVFGFFSALHGPAAIGGSAPAHESIPLFRIEMVVVAQELSRIDVPGAVDPVADAALDIDAHDIAVRSAGVIDEAALVRVHPRIDVEARRQFHDVKVRIVRVFLVPYPQPVFLFLFVNHFPHVFLNELALGNVFEGDQSPALARFSLGLALHEFSFAHAPISTVLVAEVAVNRTDAFRHDVAVETIFPTERSGALAFFLILGSGTGNLFWSVVGIRVPK